MKNLIKYKEGQSSWTRWIKKRIENNLNFIALATGPTGVGKSWAMISLAYDIDPTFEIRQIAFNLKEVMQIINSDWFKKKKWKIIIFEEAQTDISNRQWASLTNKLMNYLLSTFRHQNIILLFTTPYQDFLDSQAMKLVHCNFEIRSHSRKDNTTLVRPKLLQYNSRMKKYYEHSLYVIRDNKVNKMPFLTLKKPPKELIIPYEKAKTDFTNKLNQEILAELNKKDKPEIDTRKPLTKKQREIAILYEELGQGQLVAKKLGVSGANVSEQMKLIRKKGYYVEKGDFKEL